MKRFLLVLAASLTVLMAIGQKPVINLVFSAEHAGSYIELDSLVVKNLTQGVDTLLLYPDTVLKLEYNTGIDEFLIKNGFNISGNYPNPFGGKTAFEISTSFAGSVGLTVRDIYGRVVCAYSDDIEPGTHLFDFRTGTKGVFFAVATFNGVTQSIKMISSGNGDCLSSELEYKGFIPKSISKSTSLASGFKFAYGDQLQYFGYARSPESVPGMDMITDIPLGNAEIVFEIFEGLPCPEVPVLFYGAKYYSTVQIGNQCWMKENMAYNINNSFCYEDETANCEKYGRLYKWTAANIVCPSGWHLPVLNEWNELIDLMGGPIVAGGNLKITGTMYWESPNASATNVSGFSALPGGLRYNNGGFEYLFLQTFFWTGSEYNASRAWQANLFSASSGVTMANSTKELSLSVRCVKDQ